jgi:hypothetical protein
MDLWSWTVAVTLGVVFFGSVLNQLSWDRWESVVARYDRTMILPYWGFFAPHPGHTGNHLIYRDGDGDIWGPWEEVPIPNRTPWEFVWNPSRFERKALLDLMNGFAKTRESFASVGATQLSLAYLAMLTWVMAQPRHGDEPLRQFAVISTTGHADDRELSVAILSAGHAFC